jgi:WXG100 family type VII secretion target
MDQTRVDFAALHSVSLKFQGENEAIDHLRALTRRMVDTLTDEGWQGEGASRFYNEMYEVILPALQRLSDSLGEAAQCTDQIARIYDLAQKEAGQGFIEAGR